MVVYSCVVCICNVCFLYVLFFSLCCYVFFSACIYEISDAFFLACFILHFVACFHMFRVQLLVHLFTYFFHFRDCMCDSVVASFFALLSSSPLLFFLPNCSYLLFDVCAGFLPCHFLVFDNCFSRLIRFFCAAELN